MENVEVARRSRDLAGQLLRDNMRRAEIGVMSPLDITTARAEVAAREEAVIVAEREVRDNENFLKQLVTNDIESLLGIRVSIQPAPVPLAFVPKVEEGLERAFELRPDYRQALLDLERRKINIAFARNQALPQVDLTGSLRLLGVSDDVAHSFDRAFRRDRSDWAAGAVISIPIPNRQRIGDLTAILLERAQAVVNLKLLEQDIVVQVDNAAGQIVTTKQRIASTREASRLAAESLEAGEERLRAGTGTTFEVLELQKNLAEAEVAELRARADYHRAVADYESRTGTTIERWNIVIER
jgi:outer membrane protein